MLVCKDKDDLMKLDFDDNYSDSMISTATVPPHINNDVVNFPIKANMLPTQEILIEFKKAQYGLVRELKVDYKRE